MNFDEAMNKARRAFNRREFEQFIEPLLQTQAAKYEAERNNFVKDKIKSILFSVSTRAKHYTEELAGGKKVLALETLEQIIDSEKAKEI